MTHRHAKIATWFVLLSLFWGLVIPVPGQTNPRQASRNAQGSTKSKAEREKDPSKVRTDKERELATIRAEIEAYNRKISESERRERTTLENIDNLERQINLKRKLIRKLRDQEQRLTTDISDARTSIGDLERQLRSLKENYAKYVQSVYKFGRVYDVELLFSSKSINQLYIRIEYLKRFSEQRARDLRGVVLKKTDIETENARLETSLQRERRVLAEKTAEESSLKEKVTDRQKMLTSIRKDKRTFQAELKRKAQAVQELERVIANLIEKETLRKEREAVAARDREKPGAAPHATPVPETLTGTFASHKGKLPWPVAAVGSPVIASKFGNQVHPVLKTVRENTGIDINVRQAGSNVVAVADGEVSILTFIPGFGNTLILNNYDGFRTIYAHLSEITVTESQKVKAGEVIAKSGESVEGSILHFEIWQGKEKQNPEHWLSRQR